MCWKLRLCHLVRLPDLHDCIVVMQVDGIPVVAIPTTILKDIRSMWCVGKFCVILGLPDEAS